MAPPPSTPGRIHLAAHFAYKAGDGVAPHTHRENQVQLVLAGGARAEIDGASHVLRAKDVAFVRTGGRHAFTAGARGMRTLELKFAAPRRRNVIAEIAPVVRDVDGSLRRELEDVNREHHASRPHARVAAAARLTTLLVGLARASSVDEAAGEASGAAAAVQDAVGFIRGNAHRLVEPSEVAKRSGFNADYFYRVFKRETGKSLQGFISSARLDRVDDLLRDTELTPSQIAYTLGFGDLQHFNRFVHTHAGLSPRQLARRRRR